MTVMYQSHKVLFLSYSECKIAKISGASPLDATEEGLQPPGSPAAQRFFSSYVRQKTDTHKKLLDTALSIVTNVCYCQSHSQHTWVNGSNYQIIIFPYQCNTAILCGKNFTGFPLLFCYAFHFLIQMTYAQFVEKLCSYSRSHSLKFLLPPLWFRC